MWLRLRACCTNRTKELVCTATPNRSWNEKKRKKESNISMHYSCEVTAARVSRQRKQLLGTTVCTPLPNAIALPLADVAARREGLLFRRLDVSRNEAMTHLCLD